MAETGVELFHEWGSLQSFKVRTCLEEKAIFWIGHRVDLSAFDNLRPEYLEIHPQGLVPALRLKGQVILESTRILYVLQERFPEPRLMPTTSDAGAAVRDWCAFQDNVVHPAVRIATFELQLKPRVQAMDAAAFETRIAAHPMPERAAAYRKIATDPPDDRRCHEAIRAFRAILNRMEQALEGGNWLVGAEFTLADVAMSGLVDRLDRFGMTGLFQEFPRASAWAARIRNRAAFRAAQGPLLDSPPDPAIAERVARLIGQTREPQ